MLYAFAGLFGGNGSELRAFLVDALERMGDDELQRALETSIDLQIRVCLEMPTPPTAYASTQHPTTRQTSTRAQLSSSTSRRSSTPESVPAESRTTPEAPSRLSTEPHGSGNALQMIVEKVHAARKEKILTGAVEGREGRTSERLMPDTGPHSALQDAPASLPGVESDAGAIIEMDNQPRQQVQNKDLGDEAPEDEGVELAGLNDDADLLLTNVERGGLDAANDDGDSVVTAELQIEQELNSDVGEFESLMSIGREGTDDDLTSALQVNNWVGDELYSKPSVKDGRRMPWVMVPSQTSWRKAYVGVCFCHGLVFAYWFRSNYNKCFIIFVGSYFFPTRIECLRVGRLSEILNCGRKLSAQLCVQRL